MAAVLALSFTPRVNALQPLHSKRVLRAAQVGTSPDYNWYPGYYALSKSLTDADKQAVLDDPLVEPFTGVQFRYYWAASELSPNDYSAGFATLDADLARVAAKGKKILVMLMYKKFDGTSSVPADLRTGPGSWCSGPYCGELTNGTGTSLALLWNATVEARLKAWISGMAQHLSQSPYLANVAGIVFPETTLGTTDTTVLAAANYDPDTYIQALEDNMLAATTAAPTLITILYFEGGFVSMNGKPVNAVQKIGDWMLQHPRTGSGTPDARPKDPKKPTNNPCANPTYQPFIACAPAVEATDYSTNATDSFDQTFNYETSAVPDGLHASFLTFAYGTTNRSPAFTFADVSNNIASHPVPNTAPPWPPASGPSPPTAHDDTASTAENTGVTIDVAANDTDPDGDLDPASANTACASCSTPSSGTLVNNGDGTFAYTPDLDFSGTDGFVYEICDARAACDTASVLITVARSNRPPQITSLGGGDLASTSAPENQTAVTDVDAIDPDGDTITYSITGGADAARFAINSGTGVLTFAAPADFENPSDADRNNVYEVTVGASDGSLSDSQALSVTVTDVSETAGSPLDFSLRANGTVGGLSVANEDIVSFDGSSFQLLFDGSDVGLGSFRLDCFARLDTNTLLLSVDADTTSFPQLGAVDDSDVVRFDATSLGATTAGTFSLYFDGSDLGLTANGHDVDACAPLPDGRLLISTTGSLKVPGITAANQDLVAFTGSFGDTTTGTFSMYLDGSDVGLTTSGENIDGAAVDSAGRIYLSTTGAFAVAGIAGADEDVFVFIPTSLGSTTAGSFHPTLYFQGSTYALAANDVQGIDVP